MPTSWPMFVFFDREMTGKMGIFSANFRGAAEPCETWKIYCHFCPVPFLTAPPDCLLRECPNWKVVFRRRGRVLSGFGPGKQMPGIESF